MARYKYRYASSGFGREGLDEVADKWLDKAPEDLVKSYFRIRRIFEGPGSTPGFLQGGIRFEDGLWGLSSPSSLPWVPDFRSIAILMRISRKWCKRLWFSAIVCKFPKSRQNAVKISPKNLRFQWIFSSTSMLTKSGKMIEIKKNYKKSENFEM